MALSVMSQTATYSQFPVKYTGKITTDQMGVSEIRLSSVKHFDFDCCG